MISFFQQNDFQLSITALNVSNYVNSYFQASIHLTFLPKIKQKLFTKNDFIFSTEWFSAV